MLEHKDQELNKCSFFHRDSKSDQYRGARAACHVNICDGKWWEMHQLRLEVLVKKPANGAVSDEIHYGHGILSQNGEFTSRHVSDEVTINKYIYIYVYINLGIWRSIFHKLHLRGPEGGFRGSLAPGNVISHDGCPLRTDQRYVQLEIATCMIWFGGRHMVYHQLWDKSPTLAFVLYFIITITFLGCLGQIIWHPDHVWLPGWELLSEESRACSVLDFKCSVSKTPSFKQCLARWKL